MNYRCPKCNETEFKEANIMSNGRRVVECRNCGFEDFDFWMIDLIPEGTIPVRQERDI